MRNKVKIYTVSLLSIISGTAAHADEHGQGLMWSNSDWMHGAGHMAGYNVWGPGFLGLFIGLILWTLAVIGVYHLYTRIMDKRGSE